MSESRSATSPSPRQDSGRSASPFTPYDPQQDPFVNLTEQLSTWNKIKFVFPGLIFIPLRLLLGVGTLALCAVLCSLFMLGVKRSNPAKPLRGWRATAVEYVTRGEAWILCFSLGFMYIKVKGKPAGRKEAPIVVCNHGAAWEAFALNAVAGVTFVSKDDNAKIPCLGTCMRAMQCLFVSRENAASRTYVADEIRRRSKEDGWPQLAIFPEGTAGNQRALLSFKTGAFQPGVPVQPVIVRFPFRHMDPTHTGHKIGTGGLVLRLCSQWYNNMELTFLPVYRPSEAEQKDPQLYAENVRAFMSKAAGMEMCEYNVEDYFVTGEAVKFGIPPREAVVGMDRLRRVLNLGVVDVKETMKLFKDMDVRRKGQVSYEDFLSALGMDDSKALRATYEKIAGPGAKTLQFRQFLQTMLEHSRNLTGEEELRFAFQVINIKGDGKLTEDELEAVMLYVESEEKVKDRAMALFKKMDARKSGFVDFVQFGSFVRANPSWMELFEEVRTEQRELGFNPTLEMLARRAEGSALTVAEFRQKVLEWNRSKNESKKSK